mgnify:CR=1 FL=1
MTGIGTINPLGNNIQEYFANLKAGVSGAAPITHFDAEKFKTRFACEVKGYNWEDFFDRKEVRKYDLFSQYAMIAADQAMTDSGIDLEKVDKLRSGVIWASGIGGLRSMFDEIAGFLEGGQIPRFSPFFIPKMISDIAAGYISMKYGFMGPNFCTVSACASSNHAIILATDQIRMGRADIMITGGSESAVNQPGVGGFNSMQALSTRNDDPATASRPYDADRDGFVIGEGAGGLILEEYEHAKARGAKIYCEIAGYGLSGDAGHITTPSTDGPVRSMKMALGHAEMKPEDVMYVNAHGTSTPIGDINECKAIREVFGEHTEHMWVSSTKGATGHLLGGAGGLESVFTVKAIETDTVPPTINLENQDPECKVRVCAGKPEKTVINAAMKNNFGFGGTNATVIFKKLK